LQHTDDALCNVLRPDLEAKAKAAHRRGQGQGHKILSSKCPRGRGQSSRTPSLPSRQVLQTLLLYRIIVYRLATKRSEKNKPSKLLHSLEYKLSRKRKWHSAPQWHSLRTESTSGV